MVPLTIFIILVASTRTMMMWCDKNEFTSGFFSLLHVLYVLSTVFKEQNFMHNCLKF